LRSGRPRAIAARRFMDEEQAAFEASHDHMLELLAQAEAQMAG
jgi:L-lactate dehydrogenase